ncbi:MAG TPA: carboxypeptidase-like regulatory domain-containing protein [Bryobacteraceae bacterium]|nr:carboxypeptidase-like regulatory domain-containing protein [Bryobacteraceae bacterium]
MSRNTLVRAFLLTTFLAGVAFGQRDLGTVAGTVNDPSGGAVPNAKVTITQVSTNSSYTVTTNAAGEFVRPALQPGNYTVTAEAKGFRRIQQDNVVVTAGDRIGVNLILPVGDVNESIEVAGTAPLLQTESANQGADLNTAEVSQLPLGGQRTFAFLARLSPGVLVAEPGARAAQNGDFAANGVRSTGENNFLLNGVDNNVNVIDFINQTSYVIGPSVDAINEIRILTNGYNAEYGRAAGGVMDVTIKSGTNQLHGMGFEYLQNTDLDANRWENNLAGVERPPLQQNQFGGNAGGPILKNKLFIFGDYQGTKIATSGGVVQNLGYGEFLTIPTQAEIQGNFSALLGKQIGTDPLTGLAIAQNQIFDPTTTNCNSSGQCTRQPYPSNTIPASAMDPAARKIAALYPSPNQPVIAGNYPVNDYYALTAGGLRTDQGDGRVDYHIDDRDSLFGSISWSDTNKYNVPPFQGALDGGNFYGSSEEDLGRNAQLGFIRTWTPTVISETRIGFSRLVTARTQANSNTDEFKAEGIGGYDPTTTLNGGLPQFGMGQYSQIGANDWLPTKEYSNVWDFIQNVAINKGSHSFKFGAEVKPIQFPFFQVPYPHGEMNFSRTETAFPSTAADNGGLTGFFNTDTGDSFASFLLGAIDNGQISTTNFISSIRQSYDFYAQDDWKINRKLTLSYGVRYELWSPIGEKFGRQSNFDINTLTLQIPSGNNQNAPLPPNFNTPYTLGGVTFPADFPNVQVCRGCVSKYLIPWDKYDLGPRLGFAYNVMDKTVIRGAYGIFYGGEEQQGGNPNRGESAPFNESPQLNRPAGVGQFQPDPYFANGAATGGITIGYPLTVFTTYPVSSLQFREVSEDFRNPMVQKWNITVQRELGGQMALEVGYQGNHQSHQLFQPDDNPCPNLGTLNSSINCNQLRMYPDIGSISGTASIGYGNYAALTAKLEKHFSKGLQFISAYTWGHALANTGTTLSGSNNFQTKSNIDYNLDYSSAAWDIRQNFTTGFTWDIPFGHGKAWGTNMNKVVDSIVGNWQLNGILTLHTGQPYTVSAGGCQGVWAGCFPDLVNGANPNAAPANGRNPSEWFNTANFTAPASLTEGNLGDNTNYGPPLRNLDFSVFKDFPFSERYRLQFQADFFNIANTPQFNFPDSGYGDANFGKVTSTLAGTERHVEFALKFIF